MSDQENKQQVPAARALRTLIQGMISGSELFSHLTDSVPEGEIRTHYAAEIKFFAAYLPVHLFLQGLVGRIGTTDPRVFLNVAAEATAQAFAATQNETGISFEDFETRFETYSALGSTSRATARTALTSQFASFIMGVSSPAAPGVDAHEFSVHAGIGDLVYREVQDIFHSSLSKYRLTIDNPKHIQPMPQSFLEKAAAKASLINIKYDLDRLKRAFPHNPSASSKALMTLLENAGLAFANHAPIEQVRSAVLSPDLSPALRGILHDLVELSAAASRHDDAKATEHGVRIEEAFQASAGVPIDRSQMPSLSRHAMQSASTTGQPGSPAAKPSGCGCLVIIGALGLTPIAYQAIRYFVVS